MRYLEIQDCNWFRSSCRHKLYPTILHDILWLFSTFLLVFFSPHFGYHLTFHSLHRRYESPENMTITCSTKVCSFGKQVVEKVETEYARFENGRFVYRIHRSPMCEYMINFIHKLKHLPEKYMMNSVLENFTILQVRQFSFLCQRITSTSYWQKNYIKAGFG